MQKSPVFNMNVIYRWVPYNRKQRGKQTKNIKKKANDKYKYKYLFPPPFPASLHQFFLSPNSQSIAMPQCKLNRACIHRHLWKSLDAIARKLRCCFSKDWNDILTFSDDAVYRESEITWFRVLLDLNCHFEIKG